MENNGVNFKVQPLKSGNVYDSLESAKEAILSLVDVIDSEFVVSRYSASDGSIKSVVGVHHKELSGKTGWTIYSYDDDLIDSTIEELKGMIGSGTGGEVNLSNYYTKKEVDDKVAFVKTESNGAKMSGCTASGEYAVAEGYSTVARNQYEHAGGKYNISLSGSSEFGDSGNTLFAVGNGGSSSETHNALQIMQSGDIYIPNTDNDSKYYVKPMLHLQGKLKDLELPKDGLIDQVLTLTSDGVAWKDAPVKDTEPVVPTDSFWVRGTGAGATSGLAIKDRGSTVTGNFAFSDGYNSSATTTLAYASGQGNLSQNKLEVSFGQFNDSKQHSDTFGDSDNTLFTIGNGYNYTKRYNHNAIEIRQNGDIYFPDVVEGVNYYEYAMRRLQDIPKVWKGTWDEYSKLEKLDDNTLYYIYESSLKNTYPESELTDFGSYKPVNVPGDDFEFYEE